MLSITKPVSNYYRSPDMGDAIDFCSHISTPMEKIATMKEKITRYVDNKSDHWYPAPMIVLRDIDDMNRLKISIWLSHRMNFQDMGERFVRRAPYRIRAFKYSCIKRQKDIVLNQSIRRGVEHVGGDMFESVPKGEIIFMKWILHDWSDEHCLKLLKNCWNALPEFGKVVIVKSVVPEYTNTGSTSELSNIIGAADMIMLAVNPGGKERSLKEFEALAKQSGFATVELVCSVAVYSVLEFHKKV